MGCEFDCLYCYARGWWEKWGLLDEEYKIKKIIPNREIVKSLKIECKRRKEKLPVLLSAVTDPYQPIEKEEELTRKVLEILKRYSFPIMIQTKSDLVKRDSTIFSKTNSFVSLTIPSLDETFFERFEPKAPPPKNRLSALEYLAENEVKTGVFLDPILPGINDQEREIREVVKEARDAGALHVTFGVLRINKAIWRRLEPALSEKERNTINDIYFRESEFMAGYYYARESYRYRLVKKVSEIVRNYSMTFGSCRSGFSQFNTSLCDGQAYLR
jgi:DNA repair photolyase